jgi:hypothetical protein
MSAQVSVRFEGWSEAPVVQAATAELTRRMQAAVIIIRDTIKRSINVGGQARDTRGRFASGTRSFPGQPPRKQSGMLFRSITTRVEVGGGHVVGHVGSNMAYARRLELGFTGSDSLGRIYDQAPRPYMRPGLVNALPAVKAATGLAFKVL